MSRLTKVDRYGHFYTNNANCRNIHCKDGENIEGVYFKGGVLAIDGEAIEKLAKLEDLEEELGCPLEVVFKAMKEGITDKRFGFNYDECKLEFQKYHGYILVCEDDEHLVKDYKKTWWLKGERDVKDKR